MRIGFLFSGQGAQFPGMMKDIYENSEAALGVFGIANDSLGRSISDLCFSGSQEELNLTHNTQPCVLAAELAAYAALMNAGIKPDAVAGFSLGEYGALVAAGVIDIHQVFNIIQARADFMQEAVPVGRGAMAAVMKLSAAEVQALCDEIDGYIIPANFNCPGQIVVSGEVEAVDRVVDLGKQRKIRVMKLPVSAPFHCDLMEPAAIKLEQKLTDIHFSKPNVPVYLNVDGLPEHDPVIIREKLIRQAKSPVRWEDTLRKMYADGVDTFIELGPGRTLTGFVNKTFTADDSIRALNVTDYETLCEVIREVPVS